VDDLIAGIFLGDVAELDARHRQSPNIRGCERSADGERPAAVCGVCDLGVPAVAGGAANRPRAQRDADPPRRVTRRPVLTDAERTRTLAPACARSADGIEFAAGSLT